MKILENSKSYEDLKITSSSLQFQPSLVTKHLKLVHFSIKPGRRLSSEDPEILASIVIAWWTFNRFWIAL